MLNRQTISGNSSAANSVRKGVGMLIILYTAVYLFPPGLVPHSGHDHLGQMDSTVEADPCHITIFHPGVVGGCSHKYHFTSNHPDCPLCHVTLVRQTVTDPIRWIEQQYSISTPEVCKSEGRVIHFPILSEARGPPNFFMV